MEQSITVSSEEIFIEAQLFVHKDYSITGKDIIVDIFAKHYAGQPVRIHTRDGENVEYSGFVKFIESVFTMFSVPFDLVTWETHDGNLQVNPRSKHRRLVPGIFVTAGNYVKPFTKELVNPKFIGASLGRFNAVRLRLAHEMDHEFPDDNYLIFQPNVNEVRQQFRHVSDVYRIELAWLESKTFDTGMQSNSPVGTIEWRYACSTYQDIWTKYQIEIVSETDAQSNFWLTEKTARCLVTGKPFALLSGTDSLKYLKDLGFTTFGNVIDESYDQATNPTQRIQLMLSSLKELYTSQDKDQRIKQMYAIALSNINAYKECIATQKETYD